MSQKRKHGDLAGGNNDAQAPSRKKPFRPNNARPYTKGKQPYRSNADPKPNSTNALKSRVRDLKRLLEKVDNDPKYKMPANIRMERERELEATEHKLAEKTAAAREDELRKKMIGKYHQVRFFDRQKATRILKRLKRELASLEDRSKISEQLQKIHNAEVDVNYAIYYPLLKPYSSLYPKRDKSKVEESGDGEDTAQNEAGTEGIKGDTEMWKAVERAMEEGTLDTLRNRTSTPTTSRIKDDERPERKIRQKSQKGSQNGAMAQMGKEAKAVLPEEEDDNSDGGFFE